MRTTLHRRPGINGSYLFSTSWSIRILRSISFSTRNSECQTTVLKFTEGSNKVKTTITSCKTLSCSIGCQEVESFTIKTRLPTPSSKEQQSGMKEWATVPSSKGRKYLRKEYTIIWLIAIMPGLMGMI